MSEQIWQCVGCGRTFVEYVNGCPHHGDVEIAPPVELVVEHRAEEPPPACGLPRPSADTICILPEDHASAWHEDVNGQAWL